MNFYLPLTISYKELRRIYKFWEKSGDPRNAFAYVIVSPLFAPQATLEYIKQLRDAGKIKILMFDSGGYQVQTGKIQFEDLLLHLRDLYHKHRWADFYVLPDYPLTSGDTDVELKVQKTIKAVESFVHVVPKEKAIAVIHGHTEEQIAYCLELYIKLGIQYVGFGSFGTSGRNKGVNLLSRRSLELLKYAYLLAKKHNLKFHIFGIGAPSYLKQFLEQSIIPTSFDSAGWMKAGAFHQVYASFNRIRFSNLKEETLSKIKEQLNGHVCPFCQDLRELYWSRTARIMHNLAFMLDCVEYIKDLTKIKNGLY